jgi:hypothetical protein
MTAERYLTSIFCDDIRREEGNKFSYMGIYGGNLLVVGFPQVLPRLCFSLSMRTLGTPPSQLALKLLKDDEVVAHFEVPTEALKAVPPWSDPAETPVYQIGTIFQLFPVQLTGPCKFRARAVCDGVEFKGGTLVVEQIAPPFGQLQLAGGEAVLSQGAGPTS